MEQTRGPATQLIGWVEKAQLRRGQRPHVLLACMPKSASTLAAQSLAAAGDLNRLRVTESRAGNAQELSRARLADVHHCPWVAQHHLLATRDNCRLIARYGVQVVVQTRSVADALVSLCDHLVNEGLEVPTVYVPEDFPKWGRDVQLDFVVRAASPWFVSFVSSWERASERYGVPVTWLRYDEVVADSGAAARRCLARAGVPLAESTSAASTPTRSCARFNVGLPGRGAVQLNDDQQGVLRRLFDLYGIQDRSRVE